MHIDVSSDHVANDLRICTFDNVYSEYRYDPPRSPGINISYPVELSSTLSYICISNLKTDRFGADLSYKDSDFISGITRFIRLKLFSYVCCACFNDRPVRNFGPRISMYTVKSSRHFRTSVFTIY